MAADRLVGEALEVELERLLEEGASFPPSQEFVGSALISDTAVWDRADADPVGFWEEQARELVWAKPWDTALDDSNPPFYDWFKGGEINASYNCVDRHVEAGLGDRVAFHWHGEDNSQRTITYSDLHREVQLAANALKDLGVKPGEVVGIYLPMIPEVVVAMLACARIGAPHNVVFGGFSAQAVAERMEVSDAKVLITASGARRKGKAAPVKEQVDAEINGRDGGLPSLEHILVVKHAGQDAPMLDGRDVWWHEQLQSADPDCPAEPFDADHPLFILYSSGSTAKPKGILHGTGGYLTGAAWTHKHVFDLKADKDVWFCSADVGWITGHTYIVYGPLANAATSIMYEGAPDYPHQGIWWELIEKYKATMFYTAPTAIRACMKWGAELPAKYDLSSLRLLGSVGEPINPKAWLWYHLVIGGGNCPIVDTWWQTETGHIMISPLPGVTNAKPGSATRPLPGIRAEVVDEAEGNEVERGRQGLLVLRGSWPGMLKTLYGDDELFIQTYFSRFGKETYLVGDAARQDADGDMWVIGRIDDVVNVSGHRLSTAEVESAIVGHPAVAEAAVIGQSDEQSGQAICAFVTLESSHATSDEIMAEINQVVADRIGKFARPKRIIWSDDLPKTRSGKIMRRLLRDIAEGRALGDVTTLRDPAVMAELEKQVAAQASEEG
ncbi:MAG: acetate--CoA ligase [Solirubrobacterales bacterium]|nr:acetate--CoA ligase [Solirubrobacterales bacterium]